MSNGHTKVQATNPDGHQLSVSHTTTDSPILPAGNLQQLQQIDPALVKWVVDQTQIEAAHRRSENSRINTFVFIERISGVVIGGIVGVAGLCIAAYVAVHGHPTVASIIGGSTLAAIVAVIVTRKNGDAQQQPPAENQRKKRKK
jgi:hypothetical protein